MELHCTTLVLKKIKRIKMIIIIMQFKELKTSSVRKCWPQFGNVTLSWRVQLT